MFLIPSYFLNGLIFSNCFLIFTKIILPWLLNYEFDHFSLAIFEQDFSANYSILPIFLCSHLSLFLILSTKNMLIFSKNK